MNVLFSRFYKDESKTIYWGAEKYSGSSGYPGVGDVAPLIIDAPNFMFHFHSDILSNSGSEWGYKIYVTAMN